MRVLSPYEARQLARIAEWRAPPDTAFRKLRRWVGAPLSWSGSVVMSAPLLGVVLRTASEGTVSVANDAAQWTVRTEAILAKHRRLGHAVEALGDIPRLDLAEVDEAIGYLAAKYKAIALIEGAGAGAAGLAGVAVDVPFLVVLSLRAVGEYANYCGVDPRLQHERLYAMQVLSYASSAPGRAKSAVLAELRQVAAEVAKRATWRQLEDRVVVSTLREVSKSVGIRLTKAKLAQAVPIAGAAVAGGFNAWYLSEVCDAAYHLYRERLLTEHRRPP